MMANKKYNIPASFVTSKRVLLEIAVNLAHISTMKKKKKLKNKLDYAILSNSVKLLLFAGGGLGKNNIILQHYIPINTMALAF